MGRKLFIVCILLVAGAVMLRAQDISVSIADGPVVKADSLSARPEPSSQMLSPDFLPPGIQPSLTLPSYEFETKEERAARINRMTFNRVMSSVDQSLVGYIPPKFTRGERFLFRALGLFLTSPYRFPDGCIPLMNPSFPFAFFRVPAMTATPSPYAPEFFPQSVRAEYDFATGTYKPVPVDWSTFQKNLNARPQGIYYNAPVPRANITPGDRIVNGL